MEVKLATSVDHHCMPVVCVLVIQLLVSFFELYCLSDVSSTQHYLPIGKMWTCTYINLLCQCLFFEIMKAMNQRI